MAPNKQNIVDSIIELIKQGTAYSECLSQVGTKWHFSKRTFDRYWKTANQQHLERQQHINEALLIVDTEMAIEARKKAIMTADERKEYLTSLIIGDVKVPYSEVKWNPATKEFETIQFIELASHTARINAIAELNKMDGDYAPAKVAQTDKDGNDVTMLDKLSIEELNYLLSLQEKVNG